MGETKMMKSYLLELHSNKQVQTSEAHVAWVAEEQFNYSQFLKKSQLCGVLGYFQYRFPWAEVARIWQHYLALLNLYKLT